MGKRGKSENKKAITNIEMSVAIILFVAAVFSIILIFNLYYKPDKINPAVLDDFEKNFLNYADDFTKVGVYVNPGSCINVSLNDNLNNPAVFFDNSQVGSHLDGGRLTFNGSFGDYYEIYNFSSNNMNFFGDCLSSDYNYTIPVQGKIFLGDKLNTIALGFSNTNIVIKDENDVELINTHKAPPKGVEVLAKTFFILVYNNQSSQIKIENCQVNVQIW